MLLHNKLQDYKIILASASPRRKELLSGLGLEFDIYKIDCDESYDSSLPIENIASYIAQKKASFYPNTLSDNEILITADTIVVCDAAVIGKPKDKEDAIKMLHLLSGKTHRVITGVTINTSSKSHGFSCTTEVTFDQLSEQEILYYIEKYKPYDKAGSYGIQEWIGFVGITGIKGSYYNVMGLPIQLLYKELDKFCDIK